MEQRKIRAEWIQEILNNWVAKKFNAGNNSMNYYGFIPGQRYMLVVAVSDIRQAIPTVFPDSDATEFYYQGHYGYFDEVRR